MSIGTRRTKSFLCRICRQYYPKRDMKYVGSKHIKVCPKCLEKVENASGKEKRIG